MASRRGAVKFNPVTGKMEKLEPTAGPDGVTKHRDGCMVIDDRYINAAKELGLGGEDGMYSHVKALTRMGAADVPHGTSIQKEGSGRGSSEKASVDAKNFGAVAAAIAKDVATTKKGVGNTQVHGFGGAGQPTGSTTAAMATAAKGVGAARVHGFGNGAGTSGGSTAGAMPTASKGVGGANVHGFGKGSSGGSSLHNHEDAFQRRKGVVNTIGGAKDVTRKPKDEAVALPKAGEKKGAHIMGIDMLDAHTVEGKARREAVEKREKAGMGFKPTAVHVSGGGGRRPTATIGGQIDNSGARADGKPKPVDIYREKMAKMEAQAVSHRPRAKMTSTVGVLGSGPAEGHVSDENESPATAAPVSKAASAASSGDNDMRAARAAHFEKMFKEQEAKKKAAAEKAGFVSAPV